VRSLYGLQKLILKKQNQFAAAELATSLYDEEAYGDTSAGETEENKAKRSQFDVPGPATGMGEREKPVTAATG
jgi:hypothetical protein